MDIFWFWLKSDPVLHGFWKVEIFLRPFDYLGYWRPYPGADYVVLCLFLLEDFPGRFNVVRGVADVHFCFGGVEEDFPRLTAGIEVGPDLGGAAAYFMK